MDGGANRKPKAGQRPVVPPALAPDQLLVTFPSGLRDWADTCGVSLQDLAVSATVHAAEEYREHTAGPLTVASTLVARCRRPLLRHPLALQSIAAEASYSGRALTYIPLPPPSKYVTKNVGRPNERQQLEGCCVYVFSADLGRDDIWSKVG